MLLKNKIKILVLIFFCLYSTYFILGSILAPIFAHFGFYDLSANIDYRFIHACHRQPDRTFWLLGYPMSICARCFGFYIGTAIFSILSIFNKVKIKLKTFILLLILVVLDISINLFFKYEFSTGNLMRFIMGIIMGILFIQILNYLFKIGWRKK